MIDLLISILQRVNRDPDLVAEILARDDLGYPDLATALHCAEKVKEDGI